MKMSNRVVRSANYSLAEKATLLDLVDKHRSTVENKKTDACTARVRIYH